MTNSYEQWYIYKNTGHNAVIYNKMKTQDITHKLTWGHIKKDKLWYTARFAI